QRSSKSSALRLVPIRRSVCNLVTDSISPPSLSAIENQSFQNLTKPARNVHRQSLGRRVWSNSHIHQRFHCHPLFSRRKRTAKSPEASSNSIFRKIISSGELRARLLWSSVRAM